MALLERYDGKKVRIVTEDGFVFTGTAESFGSGYGLAEFGREEESLRIGDTFVFLSDIGEIAPAEGETADALPGDAFESLMGRLLEGPYMILDILPEQVPADAPGQYFAADRYFRKPERLRALYRRFAELLIRLNCYDDMAVTFDGCEHWERNPDPETFAQRLEGLPPAGFFRAVFEDRETMMDLDPGDTNMTVFDPRGPFLDRVRSLAAASGLFLWEAKE